MILPGHAAMSVLLYLLTIQHHSYYLFILILVILRDHTRISHTMNAWNIVLCSCVCVCVRLCAPVGACARVRLYVYVCSIQNRQERRGANYWAAGQRHCSLSSISS